MTIASRLASTALLALLSVAMAVPSCATAGPIAVKCGLQDVAIAASDYAEIAADVRAKDWTDLAKEGEKIGWATLDCVLGDQVAKDGSIKANVDEFRRLKSVEFRAAGVSASNRFQMQSGEVIAAGASMPTIRVRKASSPPASERGPLVASAVLAMSVDALGESASPAKVTLAACDRACGGAGSSIAPPDGCWCWRASRWVAAR